MRRCLVHGDHFPSMCELESRPSVFGRPGCLQPIVVTPACRDRRAYIGHIPSLETKTSRERIEDIGQLDLASDKFRLCRAGQLVTPSTAQPYLGHSTALAARRAAVGCHNWSCRTVPLRPKAVPPRCKDSDAGPQVVACCGWVPGMGVGDPPLRRLCVASAGGSGARSA